METKEIVFVHGVIYKCTNLVNGKIYIGKTVNLKRRIEKHVKSVDNTHFHRAIQKYGKENFKWEVIDSASTKEELSTKEYLHIFIFNSINNKIVYNMTMGGDGGSSIYRLNEIEKKELFEKQAASRKKTFLKKYGVDHPSKNVKIRSKYKPDPRKNKTYEEYYGADIASAKKQHLSELAKSRDYSCRDYSNCHGNGGHKHTKEAKEKMKIARKGKTYEEIYGKNSDLMKQKRKVSTENRYKKEFFEEELPLMAIIVDFISKNPYVKFSDILFEFGVNATFVRKCLKLIDINNFQKFKHSFDNLNKDWYSFFMEKKVTLQEYYTYGK